VDLEHHASEEYDALRAMRRDLFEARRSLDSEE
jgi:hypothetical protein